MLYRKPNEAGGHIYFTDEVGATVWDTALVDEFTLLAAIVAEKEASVEVLRYVDGSVVDERPQSVEEAVSRLTALVPHSMRDQFKAMKEEELIRTHHGLGRRIRNSFNLWHGNCPKDVHPDDYSMQITKAFWKSLQST